MKPAQLNYPPVTFSCNHRISVHFKSVKVFHVRSIELPFTLHLIKTNTVTGYSKAA